MSTDNTNNPNVPNQALLLPITVLVMLIVISGNILRGQTHRSLVAVGGQAVSSGVGEGETAPTRIFPLFESDDSLRQDPHLDSLQHQLIRNRISSAEETLVQTSFWMRLIPEVHVSSSFGIRDIIFIDTATYGTYILPKDSYRLTLSLSLNEIFNSAKQTNAELELDRLKTEEALFLAKQLRSRCIAEEQLRELHYEITSLESEKKLVRELLRFNELRFQQGKIEFDALTRTRLELLSVEEAIQKAHSQQSRLRLQTPTSPLY